MSDTEWLEAQYRLLRASQEENLLNAARNVQHAKVNRNLAVGLLILVIGNLILAVMHIRRAC